MERVTVSLADDLLEQFDEFIRRKGYMNRSEAVRDVLRDRLQEDRLSEHAAPHCVACLSYVFNHHERELAQRIAEVQHAHHDLIRSTMHVHLDHENCLEVSLLEGPTEAVRELADFDLGANRYPPWPGQCRPGRCDGGVTNPPASRPPS